MDNVLKIDNVKIKHINAKHKIIDRYATKNAIGND